MSERGVLAKALESPAIVIVGSVADFSAVLLLLNNQSALLWTAHHPQGAILIMASLAILLIGLLNAWLQARSLARRSQVALRELTRELSPQDKARFAEFWEDFGAESHLYYWLKNDYMVDKARYKDIRALREVVSKWNDDLTNYHDHELAAAFIELHEALSGVQLTTFSNYWRNENSSTLDDCTLFVVPPEWEYGKGERWNKAIGELEAAHDRVMEAYQRFINLAHQKRVTVR